MTTVKLTPQNFEMHSGNHKVLKFTTKDENDLIVDLTGASISWAMSTTAKSKAPIATYTLADNVTLTDPVNGLFEVEVQAVDTEPLKGAEYYHEARVTSAAGKVTTVAYGTIKMLDNVIE